MKNMPRSNSARSQHGQRLALSAMVLVIVALAASHRAEAANIFVTTVEQKISTAPGCSLQEAISSANFATNVAIDSVAPDGTPHMIATNCVPGTGNDTIILPSAVFNMVFAVPDPSNPFGPTATPMVTKNITILGNGAQLVVGPPGNVVRAFAVASTGNLTIQNLDIKGFSQRGGDAGCLAGGGLGAGGAIYVKGDGVLTVENSTFEGNSATGGNGGDHCVGPNEQTTAGGGGGGLHGAGSAPSSAAGGGGGGAGGNGGSGGPLVPGVPGGFGPNSVAAAGGGGGGTLAVFAIPCCFIDQIAQLVLHFYGQTGGSDGQTGGTGGIACGAPGGNANSSGGIAECPGGGGGGGGTGTTGGNGGRGNYGGGGGGGGEGSGQAGLPEGGPGGFGGGGGCCGVGGDSGSGGYGGGGAAGGSGIGGAFGGGDAGGGGALGGAIFNDGGTVTIHNSTFTANVVLRGVGGLLFAGGDLRGGNGADAGGAIFSRNGRLTVVDSTISGNQATGSGGGIVVYEDGLPTSFTLNNTIIANNGPLECYVTGSVTLSGANDLITMNGTGGSFSECPGVITSADPKLMSLLLNAPGNTPTMAIPLDSPALNAADMATSLPEDQRGVPRTQFGGDSIGAYEPCRNRAGLTACPAQIVQAATLTMQVSPPGAGSTTPPVGMNNEPLGSVTPITATPSAGFAFFNWTGAVAGTIGDPNNASTTVIMNQDQTVTANFVVCQPGVNLVSHLTSLIRDGVTGDIVATVTITNQGCDAAGNVQVTASTLKTSATSTTLPVLVGSLAGGGGQGGFALHYPGAAAAAGTAAVLRVSLTFTNLATSSGGNAGASFRVTAP